MLAMNTKRPYYPTKAAWARAEVAARRRALDTLPEERLPSSNWRAIRSRASGREHLRQEMRKFERMAARFEARGE